MRSDLAARLAVQRATVAGCDATPYAAELDAACQAFVAHLDALTQRVSEHVARSLAGRATVVTRAQRASSKGRREREE